MKVLDLLLFLIAAANLVMAPFAFACGDVAPAVTNLFVGLVVGIGTVALIRWERRRGLR